MQRLVFVSCPFSHPLWLVASDSWRSAWVCKRFRGWPAIWTGPVQPPAYNGPYILHHSLRHGVTVVFLLAINVPQDKSCAYVTPIITSYIFTNDLWPCQENNVQQMYTVDWLNALFETIPETCIVDFLGFFYLIWCNLLTSNSPQTCTIWSDLSNYLENESNSETHLLV